MPQSCVFPITDLDFGSIIKSVGDNEQITISCHRNICDIEVPCLGYINDFAQGELKTLIEIEKIKCKDCGKFFIKESESPLCISCIKNKDIEESFFG